MSKCEKCGFTDERALEKHPLEELREL